MISCFRAKEIPVCAFSNPFFQWHLDVNTTEHLQSCLKKNSPFGHHLFVVHPESILDFIDACYNLPTMNCNAPETIILFNEPLILSMDNTIQPYSCDTVDLPLYSLQVDLSTTLTGSTFDTFLKQFQLETVAPDLFDQLLNHLPPNPDKSLVYTYNSISGNTSKKNAQILQHTSKPVHFIRDSHLNLDFVSKSPGTPIESILEGFPAHFEPSFINPTILIPSDNKRENLSILPKPSIYVPAHMNAQMVESYQNAFPFWYFLPKDSSRGDVQYFWTTTEINLSKCDIQLVTEKTTVIEEEEYLEPSTVSGSQTHSQVKKSVRRVQKEKDIFKSSLIICSQSKLIISHKKTNENMASHKSIIGDVWNAIFRISLGLERDPRVIKNLISALFTITATDKHIAEMTLQPSEYWVGVVAPGWLIHRAMDALDVNTPMKMSTSPSTNMNPEYENLRSNSFIMSSFMHKESSQLKNQPSLAIIFMFHVSKSLNAGFDSCFSPIMAFSRSAILSSGVFTFAIRPEMRHELAHQLINQTNPEKTTPSSKKRRRRLNDSVDIFPDSDDLLDLNARLQSHRTFLLGFSTATSPVIAFTRLYPNKSPQKCMVIYKRGPKPSLQIPTGTNIDLSMERIENSDISFSSRFTSHRVKKRNNWLVQAMLKPLFDYRIIDLSLESPPLFSIPNFNNYSAAAAPNAEYIDEDFITQQITKNLKKRDIFIPGKIQTTRLLNFPFGKLISTDSVLSYILQQLLSIFPNVLKLPIHLPYNSTFKKSQTFNKEVFKEHQKLHVPSLNFMYKSENTISTTSKEENGEANAIADEPSEQLENLSKIYFSAAFRRRLIDYRDSLIKKSKSCNNNNNNINNNDDDNDGSCLEDKGSEFLLDNNMSATKEDYSFYFEGSAKFKTLISKIIKAAISSVHRQFYFGNHFDFPSFKFDARRILMKYLFNIHIPSTEGLNKKNEKDNYNGKLRDEKKEAKDTDYEKIEEDAANIIFNLNSGEGLIPPSFGEIIAISEFDDLHFKPRNDQKLTKNNYPWSKLKFSRDVNLDNADEISNWIFLNQTHLPFSTSVHAFFNNRKEILPLQDYSIHNIPDSDLTKEKLGYLSNDEVRCILRNQKIYLSNLRGYYLNIPHSAAIHQSDYWKLLPCRPHESLILYTFVPIANPTTILNLSNKLEKLAQDRLQNGYNFSSFLVRKDEPAPMSASNLNGPTVEDQIKMTRRARSNAVIRSTESAENSILAFLSGALPTTGHLSVVNSRMACLRKAFYSSHHDLITPQLPLPEIERAVNLIMDRITDGIQRGHFFDQIVTDIFGVLEVSGLQQSAMRVSILREGGLNSISGFSGLSIERSPGVDISDPFLLENRIRREAMLTNKKKLDSISDNESSSKLDDNKGDVIYDSQTENTEQNNNRNKQKSKKKDKSKDRVKSDVIPKCFIPRNSNVRPSSLFSSATSDNDDDLTSAELCISIGDRAILLLYDPIHDKTVEVTFSVFPALSEFIKSGDLHPGFKTYVDHLAYLVENNKVGSESKILSMNDNDLLFPAEFVNSMKLCLTRYKNSKRGKAICSSLMKEAEFMYKLKTSSNFETCTITITTSDPTGKKSHVHIEQFAYLFDIWDMEVDFTFSISWVIIMFLPLLIMVATKGTIHFVWNRIIDSNSRKLPGTIYLLWHGSDKADEALPNSSGEYRKRKQTKTLPGGSLVASSFSFNNDLHNPSSSDNPKIQFPNNISANNESVHHLDDSDEVTGLILPSPPTLSVSTHQKFDNESLSSLLKKEYIIHNSQLYSALPDHNFMHDLMRGLPSRKYHQKLQNHSWKRHPSKSDQLELNFGLILLPTDPDLTIEEQDTLNIQKQNFTENEDDLKSDSFHFISNEHEILHNEPADSTLIFPKSLNYGHHRHHNPNRKNISLDGYRKLGTSPRVTEDELSLSSNSISSCEESEEEDENVTAFAQDRNELEESVNEFSSIYRPTKMPMELKTYESNGFGSTITIHNKQSSIQLSSSTHKSNQALLPHHDSEMIEPQHYNFSQYFSTPIPQNSHIPFEESISTRDPNNNLNNTKVASELTIAPPSYFEKDTLSNPFSFNDPIGNITSADIFQQRKDFFQNQTCVISPSLHNDNSLQQAFVSSNNLGDKLNVNIPIENTSKMMLSVSSNSFTQTKLNEGDEEEEEGIFGNDIHPSSNYAPLCEVLNQIDYGGVQYALQKQNGDDSKALLRVAWRNAISSDDEDNPVLKDVMHKL